MSNVEKNRDLYLCSIKCLFLFLNKVQLYSYNVIIVTRVNIRLNCTDNIIDALDSMCEYTNDAIQSYSNSYIFLLCFSATCRMYRYTHFINAIILTINFISLIIIKVWDARLIYQVLCDFKITTVYASAHCTQCVLLNVNSESRVTRFYRFQWM